MMQEQTDFSWRFRVVVLEEEGAARKLSHAKYQRFLQGKDSYPEFAGQVIKIAYLALRFYKGKSLELTKFDYMKIHVDINGYLDEEKFLHAKRLITEYAFHSNRDRDIRPHLKKREYDREFAWEPTEFEYQSIVRTALSGGLKWRKAS